MLHTLVDLLTRWCAPWQAFYDGSAPVETAVTSVHLVAMLLGGGIAVAADRTTLGILRRTPESRDAMLPVLHATHRPVIIGLGVLLVSGLALAAADVPTFAASPAFLLKLVLVFLLVANGAVLRHTEQALRRQATEALWRRLGLVTRVSLGLWITTAVVGAVLVNAA